MRLSQLFGLGMLALALLVSGAVSQDKKDEKKEEKKKADKKKDGSLPPGFKGIELTAEQLEKIAGVRKERKPELDELGKKVADLNKKIGELKKAELDAILSLLTSEQRKTYAENTAPKKKKDGEKKKDDKKADEKKTDTKKDEKKDDKK